MEMGIRGEVSQVRFLDVRVTSIITLSMNHARLNTLRVFTFRESASNSIKLETLQVYKTVYGTEVIW